MLGLADRARIVDLFEHVMKGDVAAALAEFRNQYDTGADLHAHLVLGGARFAALPESLWGDVEHYHGTTREKLANPCLRAARRLRLIDTGKDPDRSAVERAVRSRLQGAYGIDAK